MVVASGGWVQNAICLANQTNSNVNTTQTNKMTAKAILICRENSHPFQERTLSLDLAVKIGRSVARVRATPNNAIFDCKVLSRNHALLWYSASNFKFYLQDTQSSNGTFVNNQRLSASGVESAPKEVYSGDVVQFGVDVVESQRKLTHGCIVATLKLFLPDGKEAKASLSTSVVSTVRTVTMEDLYKLSQVMEEAWMREKGLCAKLTYLKQLVETTRTAADKSWQALITEDRLLSWVDTVENQLAVYSKKYTEDKIRNELVKLQEEKAEYQNAAKEALEKVLQEKTKAVKHAVQLEGRLSNRELECLCLHNELKFTQKELEEMCKKYSQTQEQLQETTANLMGMEEKIAEIMQNSEREKQELMKELDDQSRIEATLRDRLRDSRLDSVNIYKQITTVRNYMQTLQDMNPKMISDELNDSKDEQNPIEAIKTILNKLNSIHADNIDVDAEDNLYSSKAEQDNQINSQDMDSNQLKTSNLTSIKDSMENSLTDMDNLKAYIFPPPTKKCLVNGNGNIENSDSNVESDTISDATDDTSCTFTDDISENEKSIIENKKEEEVVEATPIPYKMEVRFACEELEEKVETRSPILESETKGNGTADVKGQNVDNTLISNETPAVLADTCEETSEVSKDSDATQDGEDEHLEGEYIKTLKPLSKNESMQQSHHTREYILQSLIGSLESLKGDDDLESAYAMKKELEELKDWLTRESHEIVVDRLKELYYKAKNESQRIQEVHEELVILKEKYNVFVEEKAELSRKYTTLKAQCGDLLNTTYTVPIHYVAPIVIMLVWMLLEKIF